MVQSPGMSTPPAWQRWIRQPQSFWLRRAIFQVHLWSGLGIGLIMWWNRVVRPQMTPDAPRRAVVPAAASE